MELPEGIKIKLNGTFKRDLYYLDEENNVCKVNFKILFFDIKIPIVISIAIISGILALSVAASVVCSKVSMKRKLIKIRL